MTGIAVTPIATIRPLSWALGPSRGLVVQGYVIALGEVVVGASLVTQHGRKSGPVPHHAERNGRSAKGHGTDGDHPQTGVAGRRGGERGHDGGHHAGDCGRPSSQRKV